jgi:hypothetical protein
MEEHTYADDPHETDTSDEEVSLHAFGTPTLVYSFAQALQ